MRIENDRYYIVRSDNAGVFFGKISMISQNEVTMTDVRKLWYWEGACAVEQLALEGTKEPDNCLFTVVVPEITVMNVAQILSCTEEAAKNLSEVYEWRK